MVDQESKVAEAMRVILSKFVRNQRAIANIGPNTNIKDELGISSVNVIEMLLAIEEEFGVSIDDDEIFRVVTFQDCVSLVCGKRAGTPQESAAP